MELELNIVYPEGEEFETKLETINPLLCSPFAADNAAFRGNKKRAPGRNAANRRCLNESTAVFPAPSPRK